MKLKFVLFSLLFATVAALADDSQFTIRDLTKNCGNFYDSKQSKSTQYLRTWTTDGKETKMSADNIKDILDLNVVSYYDIEGYETELKREFFKETEEYQQYETALKEIRKNFKNSSFYYIHSLESDYNLEKRGFLYEIELYESNYANFPGYINHGTLCIEYATKRFPNNKLDVSKVGGGRNFFYVQQTYFPIIDKRLALRIEEAGYYKVGVLFVFKIDSTKVVGAGIWSNTFILTKTEGIYIVNTETGEVYCKVL